jgi:hypothetical protein
MKAARHDIFSVYELLCDFELCGSEHIFSVEFLGRSRTYLAYLRSSGNFPNVESLVFLGVKLMDASARLLNAQTTDKELLRKAEALREAGGDILRLAIEQAQALAHCDVMLSNNTSLDTFDSCAVKRLGEQNDRKRSFDSTGSTA